MLNKITFILAAMFSLFVIVSCGDSEDAATNNKLEENELGFINASLTQDEGLLGDKANYSKKQPGTSQTIERSFENAPPMIPHTVENFFPIKKKSNICLTCHIPDVAKTMDPMPTPIPETHFQNWRPDVIKKDGKYLVENNSEAHNEDLDKLNNAYFNCSQCHVPQADVSIDIKNLFTPEFRDELNKNKSNLKDKSGEGI